MTNAKLPTWMIILVAGFPLLSETVYSPSLPDIAHDFKVSGSLVEYTLTIYLYGFALGTLFWGIISDKFGRKPCLLSGLIIYVLGAILCYLSNDISSLLIARLIQSFGGGAGSVLIQAMTRDIYHGKELNKIYAVVGTSLGIFPAIGPIIGGYIVEFTNWYNIFLFLVIAGLTVTYLCKSQLSETHTERGKKEYNTIKIFKSMIINKKVIAYASIVSMAQGISYSYYAEGSFFMIKLLGLTPSEFGRTFFLLAMATCSGGFLAKKLLNHMEANNLLKLSTLILLIGSCIFASCITLLKYFAVSNIYFIVATLICMMVLKIGLIMTNTAALSQSIQDYRYATGTASSIFGFGYYLFASLVTLIMGMIHNGTIYPMPFFFFILCIIMFILPRKML